MQAGERKDAEWYRRWLDALQECIFEDRHDDCAHHDEHTHYSTPQNLLVTCPAHRKLLETHLQKMRDAAHRMIDPEYGRIQNNLLESGFFHVWAAGVKRRCMGAKHFYMIVCQGLLSSNQTGMRVVKGPDYSWRLAVYKKLKMPVGPTVMEMERKRQKSREKNRLRMQARRADGRKARGKHEAHHRQQQRKNNAKMMRDSRGFEKLSLQHNGKSAKLVPKEDSSDVVQLQSWHDVEPRLVPPSGRLLVVLDINETLLWCKYLVSIRAHAEPIWRPSVDDFVRRLLDYVDQGVIDLGVWCGAWTHKRESELLKHLQDKLGLISKTTGRGSTKIVKNLAMHCRSLPGCKTRHFFKDNPGKSIVIKPVSMIKMMLPQYDDVVLFDNNIEKMLGMSQKKNCRLSNSDDEYIIVKSFRGDPTDKELEYGVGEGCTKLFKFIESYKSRQHLHSCAI